MRYKLHQDIRYPRHPDMTLLLQQLFQMPSMSSRSRSSAPSRNIRDIRKFRKYLQFDVNDEDGLQRMMTELINPAITWIGDHRMLDPMFLNHLLRSNVVKHPLHPDGRRYSKEIINVVTVILECARELLFESMVNGMQGRIDPQELRTLLYSVWFLAMKQTGVPDFFRSYSTLTNQTLLEILLGDDQNVKKADIIRSSNALFQATEWQGCVNAQMHNHLSEEDKEALLHLHDQAVEYMTSLPSRSSSKRSRSSPKSSR